MSDYYFVRRRRHNEAVRAHSDSVERNRVAFGLCQQTAHTHTHTQTHARTHAPTHAQQQTDRNHTHNQP
eukprot:COSAG06_NODE_25718_length_630_cov_0.922787_2_plen_68_part_01